MRAALVCPVASALLAVAQPGIVSARTSDEPDGSGDTAADGSVSVDSDGANASAGAEGSASQDKPSKRLDQPWILRWRPERNTAELGVFGGAFFPARDTELFEPDLDLPDQGFKPLRAVAPELGARIGYYPIRYLGLEAEGAWSPARTDPDDDLVNLWMVRGHIVGQLGWWSVTPFALVGGGVLAASSPRSAVGTDIDAGLHFGFGVKFYINRYVMARVELRDTVAASRGVADGATNNLELLAGLSVTLGRSKNTKRKPPSDRDRDGFVDQVDKCPDKPGVAPDGCPLPDSDGDGFLDIDDKCPQEPGIEPDGCPPIDSDGDGFLDPDDKCPQEPGIAPDGCPDLDPDNDAILNPDDKCPNDPETVNGFEDEDGCPDDVPDELAAFTGTIEGVYFEVSKAVLRPQSKKTLENAVEVLKKYSKVRVEISGHTDSTGSRELNMDLSQRRADAVKKYLVDQGIDDARIETRGAGPDEPIDTNSTKEGRAKNRRIEFRQL